MPLPRCIEVMGNGSRDGEAPLQGEAPPHILQSY